jgi:2,3-bisphosphoglycerate-independent phosphoglycerate mutase
VFKGNQYKKKGDLRMKKSYKPVALIILDGWGFRLTHRGNAIIQASTPNYDHWLNNEECCIVDASGKAVGLESHQMGNSEVGHLNLGAGRIVLQDVTRINNAIRSDNFEELLSSAIRIGKDNNLHLVGLLGDGGVHADDRHLYAILKFAKKKGIKPVIHMITDGRDTSPTSSMKFLQNLQDFMEKENIDASIATVSGRYYAMDRDKRWDRTQKAYEAMVNRNGENADSPRGAIEDSYRNDVTDEFIIPAVIDKCDRCCVEEGDTIFFHNFRADRMRQIVKMFSTNMGLSQENAISNLNIITMTTYDQDIEAKVLFPMEVVTETLAEHLSKNGFSQFHIAETEKYAHVTYFFNGRREKPFKGEERILVPSPKVATYDKKPEMSAFEVTDIALERLRDESDDFILLNFANPDMVGHTGQMDAAIKAVETVDECVGRLVDAITSNNGVAIVTADHGNAEIMLDHFSGDPHTAHTTNPVPLFIMGKNRKYRLYPRGIMADIAPTIFDLLGLTPPSSMSGESLIWHENE